MQSCDLTDFYLWLMLLNLRRQWVTVSHSGSQCHERQWVQPCALKLRKLQAAKSSATQCALHNSIFQSAFLPDWVPKCQVPVECDWGASLFWREAFEKAEHWPNGSLSAKSLVKLVGCALTLLIFVQVLSAAESSPLRSQWGESSDGGKCAC